MSHSLNEVRALAIRAARGAGFDWGMAEEAGFAVRWLSAMGLPGAMVLARQLTDYGVVVRSAACETKDAQDEPVNSEQSFRSACPLTIGAWVSDRAHEFPMGEKQTQNGVQCPLLLIPFLCNVARQRGATVSVLWTDQHLLVDASCLWWFQDGAFHQVLECDVCDALDPVAVADIVWELRDVRSTGEGDASAQTPFAQETPSAPLRAPLRAPLDTVTLKCLSLLASRTYAPATEESRRLGAGGAD